MLGGPNRTHASFAQKAHQFNRRCYGLSGFHVDLEARIVAQVVSCRKHLCNHLAAAQKGIEHEATFSRVSWPERLYGFAQHAMMLSCLSRVFRVLPMGHRRTPRIDEFGTRGCSCLPAPFPCMRFLWRFN